MNLSRAKRWGYRNAAIVLVPTIASIGMFAYLETNGRAKAAYNVAIIRSDVILERLLRLFWQPLQPGLSIAAASKILSDEAQLRQRSSWIDIPFEAANSGWRMVYFKEGGGAANIKFMLDAPVDGRVVSSSGTASLALGKMFWVERGRHRLRAIAQDGPNGALPPPLTDGMRIVDAPTNRNFRIVPTLAPQVFRRYQCSPIEIQAGGLNHPFAIEVSFSRNDKIERQTSLMVPASARPTSFRIARKCDEAGDVVARVYVDGIAPGLTAAEIVHYAVLDPARAAPSFIKGALALEIDPAAQEPEFGTHKGYVVRLGAHRFRVAGGGGAATALNKDGAPASWFGYRVSGLRPGQAYTLEFNYPNDEPRLFVVGLRDSVENGYPPSIAIQTGGVGSTDKDVHTASVRFWAASQDARLLIFNYFTGLSAAIGQIRIYKTNEAIVAAPSRHPSRDQRISAVWYEEGERYRDIVGMNHDHDGQYIAADRFMRLLQTSGTNTLVQAMSVYNYQLYPSKLNDAADVSGRDAGAALMLAGERYGVTVVAELHPRADSLVRSMTASNMQDRLLLSRDGTTNLIDSQGKTRRPPYFNLLDPVARSWYLDAISEALESFATYPAFKGVALRISGWRNPGLNNFVSLDWGYNASSVMLFFRESGLTPPADLDLTSDTPVAAKQRADLLLGHLRQRWVTWRCYKVKALIVDIAARVRRVRPDLELWLMVLDQNNPANRRDPTLNSTERLRGIGFDQALLASVHGVRIVDSRWQYGPTDAEGVRDGRSGLAIGQALWPDALFPGSHPSILWPMRYFEIRAQLWPGEKIGMPQRKISPWISSPALPPGRGRLARYAQLLATNDPAMIGDGGNNYSAISEGLAEFMAQYRALPLRQFTQVPNAPATVATRCSGRICYLVNLAPVDQLISITLPGIKKAYDLGTGLPIKSLNGTIRLRLGAFALQTIEADLPIKFPRVQVQAIIDKVR